MKKNYLLLLFFCIFARPLLSQPQFAGDRSQGEQSSFGAEEVPDVPYLKQPALVPGSVLKMLKLDSMVVDCLKDNPLGSAQLDSWFVASEIHLQGSNESDIIVLPSPRPRQPNYNYMCFHGVAGTSWFWIFRKHSNDYELVLKTSGNSLEIMRTRSRGYRNIQTESVVQGGKHLTRRIFRFDGQEYREYGKSTQEEH